MTFLETLTRMQARAIAKNGYEGVTHAGIAIFAQDTGRVLLAQRAPDDTDDEAVRETWEFPGGGIEGDEDPFVGAKREFSEEVGLPFPAGTVTQGWRGGDDSETGHYQGFVFATDEFSLDAFTPNDEVQAVGWFDSEQVTEMETSGQIRPEIVATMDWTLVWGVSGNEGEAMTEETTEPDVMLEPDLTFADIAVHAIPVHGVLAPEDTESGDARGFNAGSVTSRPYRLPFMWQEAQTSGHDNATVVGSVDRLMRKDGLIHWEGSLMGGSAKAGEFTDMLAFFRRFGVSVDGDRGSLDIDKTGASGVVWFDAVRASGLTAVAIPAFAEAYAALGPHPEMPTDASLTASMVASGDLVTFDRGPGWVTNPVETKRIHDYWTKKGEPGYAKIGWGTPGDFTRAKRLIGEKIGKNSPEDMKYLNQIIAQWHHDALGYWPGDLDKPGNKTSAEARAEREARSAAASERGIVASEDIEADGWETVLVSSVDARKRPPARYFEQQEEHGALVIEEPDEDGFRHTYGYAAEWGVCHIGYDGRCVEAPLDVKNFEEFHLGRTKTDSGYINTGVITYKVDHRDADTILTETAEQSHFDNIANAWAAVRLGMDEHGIWFSGVVLPGIPEDDVVLIEASGQVSGEWKYGALRALQAVNVPGFPVMRSSAAYDDQGNVIALVASAHGLSGCEPTPAEQMAALRQAHQEADAESRFAYLRVQWATRTRVKDGV